MDTIVVDRSTGHVGTSSMLQTPLTPSFHKSSLGRCIKKTLSLQTYKGPKTKKTKIGTKQVYVATFDTCIFILDNISGARWDTWRKNDGGAFKQALRERVQTVCSQEHQQPGQQATRAGRQVDGVQTKEFVLKKDLRRAGIEGDVRVDEVSGLGSAYNVIDLMCPGMNDDYAYNALTRILAKDDAEEHDSDLENRNSVALRDRIKRIQINGEGRFTPVCDAKTLVEIIWLLPAQRAKEFRRQSAATICRVLGGDVSLCREIEERCARLQSTAEGRVFQQFVTGANGEQPATKKARFGPPVMMHATDNEYQSFLEAEVVHELATRHTKNVHRDLQDEVAIVFSIKDALESIRGELCDMEKIELCDKVSDIQYRMFKKVGGTTGVAEGGALAVADAAHVDPGHGVATPVCHVSVRGEEISIAQISGFLGVRLGNQAGQVGKRMKVLYTARYGEVTGASIPKRTTRFNGKPFSENVYYTRDRDLMERAINDVAQS